MLHQQAAHKSMKKSMIQKNHDSFSCNIENILDLHMALKFAHCHFLMPKGGGGEGGGLKGVCQPWTAMMWSTINCKQVHFRSLTALLTKHTNWSSPKYTVPVPVGGEIKTFFPLVQIVGKLVWIFWASVPQALQWMSDSPTSRCSDICNPPLRISHISELCFDITDTECC